MAAISIETGSGMLLGIARNKLPASHVLDSALWGRYLVACELFSAGHAVAITNLRFYLNPITFKLEPIAFDTASSIEELNWPGLRCQGSEYAMIDHMIFL